MTANHGAHRHGTPRLCIALPVRNGSNFLQAAIDSILAQTFTDFVLVVSDNASTDATPDILADAARRDSRIVFDRASEALSQVANTNRAVALSASPWIKLFCHDDLMRNDCLMQIDAAIDRFDASRVGLIGNGERFIQIDGTLSPAHPDQSIRMFDGPDFVRQAMGGTKNGATVPALTTATVRRTAFNQTGGFDERFLLFDTFFWLQLLRHWDFVYLNAQVTCNRTHPGQVAFAARKSLRMVEDYRKFIPEFLAQIGGEIDLPRAARLRMHFKPIGAAATAIKDEFTARRWSALGNMLRRLPVAWWPVLAPLTLRALYRDRPPA